MKTSFSGYSNLGCQLLSSMAWNVSFHALLAFRVSPKKFVIILTSLPLYVTLCFSLDAFFDLAWLVL
jgi:hypothetical protein